MPDQQSQLNTGVPRPGQNPRTLNLRKKARPGEMLIQVFLFFCAALSIITTTGIIYELGKESLAFFTRELWENTNKVLINSVNPEETIFLVSESGRALAPGEQFRIGEKSEVIEIVAIDGARMSVLRGVNGTIPEAHPSNLSILVSNRVRLSEFFFTTSWRPQIGEFGVLPLVNATLMTTVIAMFVALPVGLSIAIYLSEYATAKTRAWLKPIMEILAGIPTVVYGYFALTFMTPLLRSIFGQDTVGIYNMASGGIVIGILVIPLVASMSEDALHAVPNALRQAAYALGSTRLETALKVVVPAAFSGIAAAFIVTISRAIGETMVVALAVGAGPAFTFNPFEAAETMTGHLVRISGGDLSYDSIDYNSLFAIGLLLFVITLALNIVSQKIVARYREVYE